MRPDFSDSFLDQLADIAASYSFGEISACFDGFEGAKKKKLWSGSQRASFLDYASAIGQEDRLSIERLAGALSKFLVQVVNDYPDRLDTLLRKALEEGWSWENDRLTAVVTNEGRANSANAAAIEEDGLFFRSRAEIRVYRALRNKRLPFAPLPVFLRGDGTYRRIEPDFVLLIQGRFCIIEVDGPGHSSTPVLREQERIAFLEQAGAELRRIPPPKDDDEAERLVSEVLRFFVGGAIR